MAELPNLSQNNVVSDLKRHPVKSTDFELRFDIQLSRGELRYSRNALSLTLRVATDDGWTPETAYMRTETAKCEPLEGVLRLVLPSATCHCQLLKLCAC